MIHTTMRDLRLVGTTDIFPDLTDLEDEGADVFRNFEKVVTNSKEPLAITDAIWAAAGFGKATPEKRATSSAQRSAQKVGAQRAKEHYDHVETELVQHHKLSPMVWSREILGLADKIYQEEFTVTNAIERFGDWESDIWRAAMASYRRALSSRLPPEWDRQLATLTADQQEDKLAVRQAASKLRWLLHLQDLGERRLNVPLLTDKFLADFSRVFSRAEVGFKVVSDCIYYGRIVPLVVSATGGKHASMQCGCVLAACPYLQPVKRWAQCAYTADVPACDARSQMCCILANNCHILGR